MIETDCNCLDNTNIYDIFKVKCNHEEIIVKDFLDKCVKYNITPESVRLFRLKWGDIVGCTHPSISIDDFIDLFEVFENYKYDDFVEVEFKEIFNNGDIHFGCYGEKFIYRK